MLSEAEVLKQAMELPAVQRASIARQLLESLEPSDVDQAEIDAAWADEIEARAAAFDRGEVEAVDATDVIAQIRESLRKGEQV
jgi:putative addiction module component (TIGR02574 family)